MGIVRRNAGLLVAFVLLVGGSSLLHAPERRGAAAALPLGGWKPSLTLGLNRSMLLLIELSGINVILAVSLNLINGITGQFSLGHAGFMVVGAYLSAFLAKTAWLAPRLETWAGPLGLLARDTLFVGLLILAGLAAAVAGLIVGIPSLRLRGDYLAIATLGFGEIARIVIRNTAALGGASGMHDIPLLTGAPMIAAWAVLCVTVVWRLVHCSLGKGFLAVREDEIAAAALGINPTRYKVIAFVIGAFFAGVAGGLFAHLEGNLDPKDFSFIRSAMIVTMVVLGGLGSTTGVILAAVLLTLLTEGLHSYAPPWLYESRLIVFPLILILVMLFRPQGLMGRKEWIRPTRHGVRSGGEA